MKVLILCTGNSCRSQMAEAILASFNPFLEVFSAGTNPAASVNPHTITVMKEIGISLEGHYPKNADLFKDEPFDFVITVCDHARETCPIFTGTVGKQLHIGFPDPADAVGTEEEILPVYRQVRDDIRARLREFYATYYKS
ncbi:MAG: arsenate reductase ArsC [Bacteroidota bacterium]